MAVTWTTPQAVALLQSLIAFFQYLALSLDVRIAWPAELLRAFSWLRAFIDGCVRTTHRTAARRMRSAATYATFR
jgi:hypothetical protein